MSVPSALPASGRIESVLTEGTIIVFVTWYSGSVNVRVGWRPMRRVGLPDRSYGLAPMSAYEPSAPRSDAGSPILMHGDPDCSE